MARKRSRQLAHSLQVGLPLESDFWTTSLPNKNVTSGLLVTRPECELTPISPVGGEATVLKAIEGSGPIEARTLLGVCPRKDGIWLSNSRHSVFWEFVSGFALDLRQPIRNDRQRRSLLSVGSGVHQESLTIASSVVKADIERKLQPKQWLGTQHAKFIRRLRSK